MVSNIDQAFIVTSLVNPNFSLGLLDRLITLMELHNVSVVICLTKIDLVLEDTYKEIKNLMKLYIAPPPNLRGNNLLKLLLAPKCQNHYTTIILKC